MKTLATVPFYGDMIEAVKDDRGVWVSIRRVSDALGLDPDGQRRKLQDKRWATTEMISVVAEDGKLREVAAINLDCLPMWLATIEPSRVAEHVRPKLDKYQVECAAVLRRHFFGEPAPVAVDPGVAKLLAVKVMIEQQLDLCRQQAVQKQEIAEVRAVAERATTVATAVLQTQANQTGYLSVLGYCKHTGRRLPKRDLIRIGRALGKRCRDRQYPVRKTGDERYGSVNSYPVELLMEWFQDAKPPALPGL